MDGLVVSSFRRPRGQQPPHWEHSTTTFAYFNRRLERPAPSSLSSRRFLRRHRHGGSSCSRAANCSNSGTLENHFGCGRHGASAAFAAAHFVAYRSVMFAICFLFFFPPFICNVKVRKPRCIVRLRRGKRVCLLFRNALGNSGKISGVLAPVKSIGFDFVVIAVQFGFCFGSLGSAAAFVCFLEIGRSGVCLVIFLGFECLIVGFSCHNWACC